VDEAIAKSRGDVKKAEAYIRSLTGVRQPTHVRNLTQEDRLRKAAFALARTPDALDILRASLTKVLAAPLDERYRKVNVGAGAFHERVSSKTTAGVELLYACGYQPMHGFLVLQTHDPHLLRVAIEALDEARAAPAYVAGKAKIDGAKAAQMARASDDAAAAARRAAHLAKVPAEPRVDGATSACLITVRAPDGAPAGTRRFDSENTLDDLVHYVRSLEGVPEGDALVIENVTVRPARALQPARDGQLSLYSLDLWPRGQVQVRAAA